MNIHAVQLPEAALTTVAPALGPVLQRLRALIADRLLRTAYAPLILPLWKYLRRVELRFAKLAIRHAAGEFPAPAPTEPRAPRPRTPRTGPQAAPHPFPRRYGWFLKLLKHEAAYVHHALKAFLAEPETAALIAACPRAAGTLSYVFRMLALPDPRPRKPRPPRPAPKPAPAPAPRRVASPEPPEPERARLFPRPPQEMCPRAAARWPLHPHLIRAKPA